MDYEAIKQKYGLAGNLIPIDSNSPGIISYSEFGKLVSNGEDVTGLVPTVENPLWIFTDGKGETLSANAEGEIIRVPATRNKVIFYDLARFGLSPKHIEMFAVDEGLAKQKYNKIKRQKEDKSMANLFDNMNQDALKKIQEGADGMNAAPVENMDLAGMASEVGMTEGGEEVNEFDDVLKVLGDFNREHGKLHVIITAQDHRVNFALAKQSKNASKGVGTGDKANAAVSEKKKLVVKDTKPGSIKGGIISIPTNGLLTSAQLKDCQNGSSELPELRYEDASLATFMLNKDELIDEILYVFDGMIAQDPATFGQAAEYVEAVKAKTINKKGEHVTSKRLKASSSRAPIVSPGAYFPLKTFKYLSPSTKESDLDLLNFSAFYHFCKAGSTALNDLDDSQKELITVGSEQVTIDGVVVPKITSKIYTVNGSVPGMTTNKWYTKDEFLADLSIPRKKPVLSGKEKKNVTARIVTVDALKGAEDSSLTAEEFKTLVSTYAEHLNKNALTTSFGRSKGKGSAADRNRRNETKKIARAELQRGAADGLKAFDVIAARRQTIRK